MPEWMMTIYLRERPDGKKHFVPRNMVIIQNDGEIENKKEATK